MQKPSMLILMVLAKEKGVGLVASAPKSIEEANKAAQLGYPIFQCSEQ